MSNRRIGRTGLSDDDDWPWEIQLKAGTRLDDARALIRRAGDERQHVVIRVTKHEAKQGDLTILAADALDHNVVVTIRPETA